MNKVLCITGMHRSGTSLVASWLEGCGLKLYEKEGPNVGNKLGHFEDKEILGLHIKSIYKVGNQSKGWLIQKKDHPFFSKSEKEQVKRIISSREGNNWGWKEPRTTLFLETWKQLIPNLKVLLLWRSCDRVVDSLLRRSHNAIDAKVMVLSKKQAITNWIIYNQALINYAIRHPAETILVNIDHLLKKDHEVFQLLQAKFDLELSYTSLNDYFQEDLINKSERLDFSISWMRLVFCRVNYIEQKLVKQSVKFDD